VQKTILQKRNVEFIQYLQQSYLPQNNCPPEITQEYTMALQSMDNKSFKNYLKAFYCKWKTWQTFFVVSWLLVGRLPRRRWKTKNGMMRWTLRRNVVVWKIVYGNCLCILQNTWSH